MRFAVVLGRAPNNQQDKLIADRPTSSTPESISAEVVLVPAFCHLSSIGSRNTPLHGWRAMSLLEVGALCMIRTFGKAMLAGALALAAPLFVACGSDEIPPPAPAPATANSALAGGAAVATNSGATPCTNQQVRECRVELAQQGAVQNCFVGLQLCTNGAWGPCLSSDEIESQLNNQ